MTSRSPVVAVGQTVLTLNTKHLADVRYLRSSSHFLFVAEPSAVGTNGHFVASATTNSWMSRDGNAGQATVCSKTNGCWSSTGTPCLNGGTCLALDCDAMTFTCLCNDAYEGTNCENVVGQF